MIRIIRCKLQALDLTLTAKQSISHSSAEICSFFSRGHQRFFITGTKHDDEGEGFGALDSAPRPRVIAVLYGVHVS